MKQVLHAMDDDRLAGPVAERHDRFQPQQIVAAHRRQRIEPGRQCRPRDRLVADDAKGADALVVAVDVELFVVVIMVVLGLKGLVAQPALDIDAFGLRVVEAEVEQ